MLDAALMEAKELRSDEDPKLAVPAETRRTRRMCSTAGKGHQE